MIPQRTKGVYCSIPAVSPEYFSELIDHKHITSGKDKDLLKEKSKYGLLERGM